MKVFADLHHSSLFYSLKLLFEDRLGAELYRPVGLEWFDKGFWNIAKPYGDHPDTIKQYLLLDSYFKPVDGTVPLNVLKDKKPTHYEIHESTHNYTQKALTFEQFEAMDIDIIIGSIPDHWKSYRKLRDIYKPKARLIAQQGNHFDETHDMLIDGTIKNLMSSTANFYVPNFVNSVFYHQEIDTNIFYYEKPTQPVCKIKSFMNVLPLQTLYENYKKEMPEFTFQAHGGGAPDGPIAPMMKVADEMRAAHWGWHVKPGGDGFGHTIFGWGLVGRPVISCFGDYKDKLASEILIHQKTGIDLDQNNFARNVDLIKQFSEPNLHREMCEAIHKRTQTVIDYDEEESKIKRFLNDLI